MVAPSLNKTNLAHFDYHWLWGLRYHQVPPPINLSSHFDEWGKMPERVAWVQAKQKKIDGYYFKFFYWLFNIENYATDFHKLKAYLMFKQEAPMRNSQAETTSNSENGGDERNASCADVLSQLYAGISYPFLFAGQSMTAFVASFCQTRQQPSEQSTDLIVLSSVHEHVRQLHSEALRSVQYIHDKVIINWQMQNCLLLLDIAVEEGDRLAWHNIKKAYRVKLLSSHSDKGGSDSDFIILKLAFDVLDNLRLGNTSIGGDLYDELVSELQKKRDREDVELALVRQENLELENRIENRREKIEADKQFFREHIKYYLYSDKFDPITAQKVFIFMGNTIHRSILNPYGFFQQRDEKKSDSTETADHTHHQPLLIKN
ncbi:MAG: hypothetical protein Q8R83_05040 [Legionellaceae bacterium]|nr:hypothetical protein [Legionellaceae bacterium]